MIKVQISGGLFTNYKSSIGMTLSIKTVSYPMKYMMVGLASKSLFYTMASTKIFQPDFKVCNSYAV